MTRPNAIQRVTLSRQTLYTYKGVPGGTKDEPEQVLKMIRDEIGILEGIARDEPKNAEPIGLLIDAWREFAETQKMRAH
ncbi:hypothetical protein [Pelagibacterium sp. H642]|uniref:hypothetical protein n=1 Tax=Pelagibacterium sp. H642 TaxID=1881069 RepID=UPI002815C67A|nr:hypothetical protein [Pelagibacterium sp. H642]WMT90097.1 hypothetical protein NO934_15060 [Pelagibacterium sp. H642]